MSVSRFENKIEELLSSMYLKNTGDRLRCILDASAPDSWLSVVLARAKTNLSTTTYIRKFNDYNGKWELSKEETEELEKMIGDIISNLQIMYEMLVVNKADSVVGLNGKHYEWQQEGHMYSLLMKLKNESNF